MTKIRYYERRGLLDANSRSEAGYRRYLHDALTTIEFIKKTQDLGFTLEEIRSLLSLKNHNRSDGCNQVKAEIDNKLQQIVAKISDLQRIKAELQDLRTQCRAEYSSNECPLLQCCEQPVQEPIEEKNVLQPVFAT